MSCFFCCRVCNSARGEDSDNYIFRLFDEPVLLLLLFPSFSPPFLFALLPAHFFSLSFVRFCISLSHLVYMMATLPYTKIQDDPPSSSINALLNPADVGPDAPSASGTTTTTTNDSGASDISQSHKRQSLRIKSHEGTKVSHVCVYLFPQLNMEFFYFLFYICSPLLL